MPTHRVAEGLDEATEYYVANIGKGITGVNNWGQSKLKFLLYCLE